MIQDMVVPDPGGVDSYYLEDSSTIIQVVHEAEKIQALMTVPEIQSIQGWL